jgi:hypothetical protein
MYSEPTVIPDSLNSSGIYTFRVVDIKGHEATLTDILPEVAAHVSSWPADVIATNDTAVESTGPTIRCPYFQFFLLQGENHR